MTGLLRTAGIIIALAASAAAGACNPGGRKAATPKVPAPYSTHNPRPLPISEHPDWGETPAFKVHATLTPAAQQYIGRGEPLQLRSYLEIDANDAGQPYRDETNTIELLPDLTVNFGEGWVASIPARRFDRSLLKYAQGGQARISTAAFSISKSDDHHIDCSGELPNGDLEAEMAKVYELRCEAIAP